MNTKNTDSGMGGSLYVLRVEPKKLYEAVVQGTLYYLSRVSSFIQEQSMGLPDGKEAKASGVHAQKRLSLHP